ncbi:MAG: hypothetical protein M1829_003593 [Trizodia sp. TS-e1964]|nr:MAG: hypothetical protein M1829_003593 [Trizodia sp. TS-e1964]
MKLSAFSLLLAAAIPISAAPVTPGEIDAGYGRGGLCRTDGLRKSEAAKLIEEHATIVRDAEYHVKMEKERLAVATNRDARTQSQQTIEYYRNTAAQLNRLTAEYQRIASSVGA